MTCKTLLLILPEVAIRRINQDLVIQGLASKVFSFEALASDEKRYEKRQTAWMERDSGHGVHVRLSDVLDHDRNVVVPSSNCLVV